MPFTTRELEDIIRTKLGGMDSNECGVALVIVAVGIESDEHGQQPAIVFTNTLPRRVNAMKLLQWGLENAYLLPESIDTTSVHPSDRGQDTQ